MTVETLVRAMIEDVRHAFELEIIGISSKQWSAIKTRLHRDFTENITDYNTHNAKDKQDGNEKQRSS